MIKSLGERVNLAPTKRDETDITTIMAELNLGVSDAIREPLHLFADLLRLGLLENTRRVISDAKTDRVMMLEERIEQLEKENRELKDS